MTTVDKEVYCVFRACKDGDYYTVYLLDYIASSEILARKFVESVDYGSELLNKNIHKHIHICDRKTFERNIGRDDFYKRDQCHYLIEKVILDE